MMLTQEGVSDVITEVNVFKDGVDVLRSLPQNARLVRWL